MSDAELIDSFRAELEGEQAEPFVNELFRRHYAKVALWCYRMAGDRDLAADLAQEVFLKAYRNLSLFRGESSFATWLYSIARNHCLNRLQSPQMREQTGEQLMETIEDGAENPLDQLTRARDAALLREMIRDRLTETEARVVALHYLEDMPLHSVTRLLKLANPSGAKAYIVSARRKLQTAWDREQAKTARRNL